VPRPQLIYLGGHTWVLASEIVAIIEVVAGCEPREYAWHLWDSPEPRAAVLLRNRAIIPAYVSLTVCRTRWENAMGGSST
jgi:hypothetical protein